MALLNQLILPLHPAPSYLKFTCPSAVSPSPFTLLLLLSIFIGLSTYCERAPTRLWLLILLCYILLLWYSIWLLCQFMSLSLSKKNILDAVPYLVLFEWADSRFLSSFIGLPYNLQKIFCPWFFKKTDFSLVGSFPSFLLQWVTYSLGHIVNWILSLSLFFRLFLFCY